MAGDSFASERVGERGTANADDRHVEFDAGRYLERIGVDPTTVGAPSLETLKRLQRAHVTSVPFENLSIVGDPYGDREGDGVVLSTPHLYEKVVERDRGGYSSY